MDWQEREYEQLVGLIVGLGDEISVFGGMDAEQEMEFRESYSHAGTTLFPGDFGVQHIVEAGREQVEIIRECLKRVSVAKLSEDTGLPEDRIILIAAMYGNAPSAN
ncbi:MAG: hypothetical protein ABI595_08585 [Actinomycetota bacterium]